MSIDANKVYDILVDHAGARESLRSEFTRYWPSPEFRFSGSLGLGGKVQHKTEHLWTPVYGVIEKDVVSVDCYSEDETPERTKIIEKVNALLKVLS